jgi:hypothetical protein
MKWRSVAWVVLPLAATVAICYASFQHAMAPPEPAPHPLAKYDPACRQELVKAGLAANSGEETLAILAASPQAREACRRYDIGKLIDRMPVR